MVVFIHVFVHLKLAREATHVSPPSGRLHIFSAAFPSSQRQLAISRVWLHSLLYNSTVVEMLPTEKQQKQLACWYRPVRCARVSVSLLMELYFLFIAL